MSDCGVRRVAYSRWAVVLGALTWTAGAVNCRAASAVHVTAVGGPEAGPLTKMAVAGVAFPALQQLLADDWEQRMRASPVWATELGDHRFDAQLPSYAADAVTARRAQQQEVWRRIEGLTRERAKLSPADQLTLALFAEELGAARASEVCASETWQVLNGNASLFADIAYVVEVHPKHSPADAANFAARLEQVPRVIDEVMAQLQRGLVAGYVAGRESIARAVAQLDAELAKPAADWALAAPWPAASSTGGAATTQAGKDAAGTAAGTVSAPPRAAGGSPATGWTAALRKQYDAERQTLVATKVKPAFAALRAFYVTQLLPHARTVEGLTGLPGGDACYRARIREHIGEPIAPERLHAIGLEEVAKTDRALVAIGAKLFATNELAATLRALHAAPHATFADAAEMLTTARAALAAVEQKMPAYFGVQPRVRCEVTEMPAHEAPFATIAYYRQPTPDGRRAGQYVVNTFAPQTRPRFEFWALTFHEAVPGHHTQVALAQELGSLPAFRRFGIFSAFVEGWALYAEALAAEMGLYPDDWARLGQASFAAWRAARLVVDTGIHALGWSRAQAEAYLAAHTALTPENIKNEVDRYIGWPGQALAYKMGERKLTELRAYAEASLGDQFALPAFHDAVLAQGAVTLTVLTSQIHAWVAAQRAGSAATLAPAAPPPRR